MIRWGKQGEAVVGSIGFRSGGSAQAVILGPRTKVKSISVIVPGADGAEPIVKPLDKVIDAVDPRHLIELLCMQERIHGPDVLPGPPAVA